MKLAFKNDFWRIKYLPRNRNNVIYVIRFKRTYQCIVTIDKFRITNIIFNFHINILMPKGRLTKTFNKQSDSILLFFIVTKWTTVLYVQMQLWSITAVTENTCHVFMWNLCNRYNTPKSCHLSQVTEDDHSSEANIWACKRRTRQRRGWSECFV